MLERHRNTEIPWWNWIDPVQNTGTTFLIIRLRFTILVLENEKIKSEHISSVANLWVNFALCGWSALPLHANHSCYGYPSFNLTFTKVYAFKLFSRSTHLIGPRCTTRFSKLCALSDDNIASAANHKTISYLCYRTENKAPSNFNIHHSANSTLKHYFQYH